jgi:hypothetical protein
LGKMEMSELDIGDMRGIRVKIREMRVGKI